MSELFAHEELEIIEEYLSKELETNDNLEDWEVKQINNILFKIDGALNP